MSVVELSANDLHTIVSCASDLNYLNEEYSTSSSSIQWLFAFSFGFIIQQDSAGIKLFTSI